MMFANKSAMALATAAAALFATGALMAPTASAEEAKVKCEGANSCKGHSDCSTAKSSCKGMNSCKGQGWVYKKTKAECESAGGKVPADKKS